LSVVFIAYSHKQENFKAKRFYAGLLESIQRTDIVLGSTEPMNYTSSYTTRSKEIVDAEIGMCQGAEKALLQLLNDVGVGRLTMCF
jgi:hypothetical protein